MITRDRSAAALRSVAKLRELPERPQVIVVDNGSSDGTVDRVAAVPGVRVIDLGCNAASAGRTIGALAAETPYVAFSDDDSWWAPGALSRAVGLLDEHPDVALLAGRTLVGPDERDDPLNAELASSPLDREPRAPGPSVLGFLACAAVARRSALLEVGGFHPRFGVGGEEQLLALDLAAQGWRLCYASDVVAHHHPAQPGWNSTRAVRELRNDLWTAWLRHGAVAALRRTGSLARAALGDRIARDALKQCLAGLPWVIRERRPVPRALRQQIGQLERCHRGRFRERRGG